MTKITLPEPSNKCGWPNGGNCLVMQQAATKPDPCGRVWMHCESGLTYTKASMTRFMMYCVGNNVQIGDVMAFGGHPTRPGAQVCVTVRLKPEQFAAFESSTGGKLRKTPRIKLS